MARVMPPQQPAPNGDARGLPTIVFLQLFEVNYAIKSYDRSTIALLRTAERTGIDVTVARTLLTESGDDIDIQDVGTVERGISTTEYQMRLLAQHLNRARSGLAAHQRGLHRQPEELMVVGPNEADIVQSLGDLSQASHDLARLVELLYSTKRERRDPATSDTKRESTASSGSLPSRSTMSETRESWLPAFDPRELLHYRRKARSRAGKQSLQSPEVLQLEKQPSPVACLCSEATAQVDRPADTFELPGWPAPPPTHSPTRSASWLPTLTTMHELEGSSSDLAEADSDVNKTSTSSFVDSTGKRSSLRSHPRSTADPVQPQTPERERSHTERSSTDYPPKDETNNHHHHRRSSSSMVSDEGSPSRYGSVPSITVSPTTISPLKRSTAQILAEQSALATDPTLPPAGPATPPGPTRRFSIPRKALPRKANTLSVLPSQAPAGADSGANPPAMIPSKVATTRKSGSYPPVAVPGTGQRSSTHTRGLSAPPGPSPPARESYVGRPDEPTVEPLWDLPRTPNGSIIASSIPFWPEWDQPRRPPGHGHSKSHSQSHSRSHVQSHGHNHSESFASTRSSDTLPYQSTMHGAIAVHPPAPPPIPPKIREDQPAVLVDPGDAETMQSPRLSSQRNGTDDGSLHMTPQSQSPQLDVKSSSARQSQPISPGSPSLQTMDPLSVQVSPDQDPEFQRHHQHQQQQQQHEHVQSQPPPQSQSQSQSQPLHRNRSSALHIQTLQQISSRGSTRQEPTPDKRLQTQSAQSPVVGHLEFSGPWSASAVSPASGGGGGGGGRVRRNRNSWLIRQVEKAGHRQL